MQVFGFSLLEDESLSETDADGEKRKMRDESKESVCNNKAGVKESFQFSSILR